MKRIIALFMTVVVLFAATACSNNRFTTAEYAQQAVLFERDYWKNALSEFYEIDSDDEWSEWLLPQISNLLVSVNKSPEIYGHEVSGMADDETIFRDVVARVYFEDISKQCFLISKDGTIKRIQYMSEEDIKKIQNRARQQSSDVGEIVAAVLKRQLEYENTLFPTMDELKTWTKVEVSELSLKETK